MTRSPPRPVVLVGMRAVGKTSVGRRAAALSGLAFVDLDDATLALARQAGETAASAGEVLVQAGPARFRELESAALRRLLEPQPAVLVAAGGGALERADSRAWLRRTATCIWLRAEVPVLAERLRRDPVPRPPLLGEDPVLELEELLARRTPLYEEVAKHAIDTDRLDVEGAARAVAALVGVVTV